MPGESADPKPTVPQTSESKRAERFLCSGCAAAMQFDPDSGKLKCPYCGHVEDPPKEAGVAPHPYLEALSSAPARVQIAENAQEIHCQGCGSVVAFVPPQVAGVCSFCGTAIVAEPKAADPLIAPDGVLPAKISKRNAQEQVQKWLQTRWFAPNALKRLAHQEGVNGVYLPFWAYNCDTDSTYTGERGEHYYTTETYKDSSGETQTREVQHTAWYPASGRVEQNFQNVLVPATKAVAEARLNKLAPWGLSAVCAYEPAYLAGFKAQRYQVELPQGFDRAKVMMAPVIESDIRSDIGGDEQRISSVHTDYMNIMFRHLLLPVWIGAYQFSNKSYQVVINASTGEVQGERPYSAVKIFFFALFILIVVLFILYLKGQN